MPMSPLPFTGQNEHEDKTVPTRSGGFGWGYFSGFMDFIRTQGVVGLAIGFLLGGAVSKVVTALITDIVNPLVGLLFAHTASLKDAALQIGNSKIMWGDFVSTLLDFIIVAAIVYFGIKGIGLENIDKKKENISRPNSK